MFQRSLFAYLFLFMVRLMKHTIEIELDGMQLNNICQINFTHPDALTNTGKHTQTHGHMNKYNTYIEK